MIRFTLQTGIRLHAPVACALVLLCAAATNALAQPLVERPYEMLDESRSHAGLRASLLAYADSVEKTEHSNASSAYIYAGESYFEQGLLDSAIICFDRAHTAQRGPEQAVALADALLMRQDRGDLERAHSLVRSHMAGIPRGRADRIELEARAMWMLHLEDHDDSAAVYLPGVLRRMELDDVWRYRGGVVATSIPDPPLAASLLLPLAEASRMQDDAVMEATLAAVALLGHNTNSAVSILKNSLTTRDNTAGAAVDRFGGAPVVFPGRDGFELGGAIFSAQGGSRRAAVLIMAPGDTIAVYDSLITQLRRESFAVIVFARRGEPMSADASCPLPGAWRGRTVELEESTALDVQAALRMLASIYAVDTTRYVVGGMGRSGGCALRAAELDPRIRAVILASADPLRAHRGVWLGRVERLQRPLFAQVGPEDLVDLYYYTDALYQAGEHKHSRVSESKAHGRGAEIFRHDARNNLRLRQFLQSIAPVLEAD